jgi:hypothetical protein
MPPSFIPLVKSFGIAKKDGMHGLAQVVFTWLQEQVDMVLHETQGIKAEIKFFRGIFKQSQHKQIVTVLYKKRLTTRGPLSDMRNKSSGADLLPGPEYSLLAGQGRNVFHIHIISLIKDNIR